MESLLRVRNAQCRIGRLGMLKVDDFAIKRGEHWCVFGPNGAGKTLLANLLTARRNESGKYVSYAKNFDPLQDVYSVSFEEQQRLWQRDNRLDISEFSRDAQDAGTSVRNLIRSARSEQNQAPELLAQLLDELDLQALVDKGIRFLSSGQTRKVLIARALYAQREGAAKLIVLDDPLESIDRASQGNISHVIAEFLGDSCSSLQLCRRQQDILPSATHMAVMNDLSLLESGELDAVQNGAAFTAIQQRQVHIPASIPAPLAAKAGVEPDSEALIELNQVAANYGELNVLHDINWTMAADHHVLIEGPNGCGKSTLLSLIDGENHKAYGQSVKLFGRLRGSGETVWDVKARFGIVSNELHNKYVKGWRVLDVVVSGFFDSVGLYDESGTMEVDCARQWLDTLGIAELAKHYYHEISFGQQRLVLLARAMVKHPRLLILDEPCVGLDDYHRRLILGTLDVISAQANTNLIYVSHVSGEQPNCINRRLRFVADNQSNPSSGANPSYRIELSKL